MMRSMFRIAYHQACFSAIVTVLVAGSLYSSDQWKSGKPAAKQSSRHWSIEMSGSQLLDVVHSSVRKDEVVIEKASYERPTEFIISQEPENSTGSEKQESPITEGQEVTVSRMYSSNSSGNHCSGCNSCGSECGSCKNKHKLFNCKKCSNYDMARNSRKWEKNCKKAGHCNSCCGGCGHSVSGCSSCNSCNHGKCNSCSSCNSCDQCGEGICDHVCRDSNCYREKCQCPSDDVLSHYRCGHYGHYAEFWRPWPDGHLLYRPKYDTSIYDRYKPRPSVTDDFPSLDSNKNNLGGDENIGNKLLEQLNRQPERLPDNNNYELLNPRRDNRSAPPKLDDQTSWAPSRSGRNLEKYRSLYNSSASEVRHATAWKPVENRQDRMQQDIDAMYEMSRKYNLPIRAEEKPGMLKRVGDFFKGEEKDFRPYLVPRKGVMQMPSARPTGGQEPAQVSNYVNPVKRGKLLEPIHAIGYQIKKCLIILSPFHSLDQLEK